jgi:hypothetical protein
VGSRTAFHGGGVNANRLDPIEVERSATIGVERVPRQSGDGGLAGNRMHRRDRRTVAVYDFKARRIFRRRHEKLQ